MPASINELGQRVETLFDGLQPIPRDAGLRIEGYYVWCGSVIKVGATYHMFASRWPVETGFPDGYRSHSEIVRATASSPLGPYHFQEVVIGSREGAYWDSKMAHNPTIHRAGDGFVLFYIGSAAGSGLRKVGYATAPDVTGPWLRLDHELELGEDANNPAPCIAPDGSVLLNFRNRELRMSMATAPSLAGPYEIENWDIMPGAKLEDGYLYRQGSVYHLVCEDNRAQITGHDRWGAHLVSEDGVHGWRPADPTVAYTHTVIWDDGTRTTFERRERPQLFFDASGCITHLCTAVLYQGRTWCLVQPVASG